MARWLGVCLLLPLVAIAAERTVRPALTADTAPQWRFVSGRWQLADGVLRQTQPDRLGAAVLAGPAFTDSELSVEFRIAAEGQGVRAAAVLFRATGTLTYYWLHLDSKHSQAILVRRTPHNPWIEITRRRGVAIASEQWHRVQVGCVGGHVTVRLDDREILQADDTNLPAGYVGLGTSQGQVEFRTLVVKGQTAMDTPLRDEQPPFRVISLGAAAGPYQAFPDVCRCANGDLLAVFYAGYGHVSLPTAAWPKGGRIGMVRSSDDGRTWTETAVLFDSDLDDRDPHIAQMSDGSLVCTFFQYWRDGNQTRFVTCLTRSRDGGRTWDTTAQRISPEGWAVSAPVRELRDGTWLLGVYTESGGHAWGGVLRSTDRGATWSAPIPIGQEANLPLDAETDVIELRDGTILAALRSSKVNLHVATSADKGLTWTPVKDAGFPGHAPHLYRLSTGEILMTHRLPATAAHLSRDDGRTWQGPYQLDSVGGAYPSSVELRDGSVLVIYYEEGEGSAIRALRVRVTAQGVEVAGP